MQMAPSMRREALAELEQVVGAEYAPIFLQQFEDRLPEIIHKGIRAQQALSKINFAARHRGVDGLGQCTMRFAPDFRYAVGLLFGKELAADDRFCAEIERDNCNIKLKPTYERLPSIIVIKPKADLQTVAREPHTLEVVPKATATDVKAA